MGTKGLMSLRLEDSLKCKTYQSTCSSKKMMAFSSLQCYIVMFELQEQNTDSPTSTKARRITISLFSSLTNTCVSNWTSFCISEYKLQHSRKNYNTKERWSRRGLYMRYTFFTSPTLRVSRSVSFQDPISQKVEVRRPAKATFRWTLNRSSSLFHCYC